MLLLFLAGPAAASQRLSDVDVHGVSLQVNRRGEALVIYTRASGEARHVLAWGAINAREPSPDTAPVKFRIDNSGGWGKERRLVWKTFKNAVRVGRWPGARLGGGDLQGARRLSTWALQSWVRILPLRGIPPFKPGQGRWELHLSHWTGPLGVLQVSPNWTYGGTWQGLSAALTYHGWAVHGYRTPSSTRADLDARYFYIPRCSLRVGAWGWEAGGRQGDPQSERRLLLQLRS